MPQPSTGHSNARRPATRRRTTRAGFTFVELLAVIVLLGILAGFSLVRLSHLRGRAWLASMQTDLHNLIVSQEAHYVEFGVYAEAIADGPATTTTLSFTQSQGTDAPVIAAIAGGGYSVTLRNSVLVRARNCAVSIGGTAPWPRTVAGLVLPTEGEIVCE